MKQTQMNSWPSDGVIPDDVSDIVELGQENLRALWRSLTQWRDNFEYVCREYDDQDLMQSYSDVVAMTKSLFDSLERMRWLIGEHNVDCEPKQYSGVVFSTPEEIQAWCDSLKSGETMEDNGG
ncbi:hypothetical protein ACXZ3X_001974 [Escherichia coli]|nr:hypothetical protein [Escherichia coli]